MPTSPDRSCRRSKIHLLTSFLLLLTCSLSGQGMLGWNFDLSYQHGKIIKHSPKIAYEIPPRTGGLFFNARFQTHGNRDWNEWQGFPELGLAIQWLNLGDREVLGHAIGLVPHFNIHLIDRGRFQSSLMAGAGPGVITRPYDVISNPLNTAIGSHLNAMFAVRLDLAWQVNQHWTIRAGGSFTHLSNGAGQSPNLGVNIPTMSIGVGFSPKPVADSLFKYHGITKKADRKWGAIAHFDIAFRENAIPGGPKYPVYIASVGGRFRLNKVNDLSLGLGYEYHRSVFDFGLHSFTYHTKEEARKAATRWMLTISDEFHYGPVGVVLQLGVYLGDKGPSPVFTKLAVRYYLPAFGDSNARSFLGFYLKSHRGVAEYFSLGAGIRL